MVTVQKQGDKELDQRVVTSSETAGIGAPGSMVEKDEQVSGRVKWFDVVKGYGFVTPEDGDGDVLVHYNLLGALGRKSLPEGASMVLMCRRGPRGRQASVILHLDLSTATGPDSERHEQRSSSRLDPLDFLEQASDFEQVEVRWFNRAKGYGFLLRNDGVTQVFVHMETVRRAGLEGLLPGQMVRARVHEGPRGALAVALDFATDSDTNR